MPDQAYVALAVGSTFLAILLVAAVVAMVSRGRRSVHVLQSQLETAGVGMAPDGSAVSFSDRLLVPTVAAFSRAAARITPSGLRAGVERRLVLAGSSKAWTAESVIAFQFAVTVGCAVLGYHIGTRGDPDILGPLLIPVLAFVGFMLPVAILDRRARSRQEQIRSHLADTIDLLTISVEAGLSFDASLLHARRTMRGPLSEEVGRMLHEMQLGVGRADAMRHLAERTDVQELRSFVLAMVQADVFGVSIANVLRAQSQELRTKRRQLAEERAMKLPVKLLFPMLICILPALLVLVVGPGVIRISQALF